MVLWCQTHSLLYELIKLFAWKQRSTQTLSIYNFRWCFFRFLARQFGCSEFCSDSEKWRRNIFPSFYCSRWPMKLIHFQRLAAKSWSSEDCLFLCDDRLYKVAKLRLRLKENEKTNPAKWKEKSDETWAHSLAAFIVWVLFLSRQSIVSKCFVCFFAAKNYNF